jgi:hypothetical protein
MADDFTYSVSDNRIVQVNGTSGSPKTFADMHDADMAGSVELLAAWSPDSHTKALTYQVQSADSKALLIDFVVASKTNEPDYIYITGTDAWGNAQSEAIYTLQAGLGPELVTGGSWTYEGDWVSPGDWYDDTQTGTEEHSHYGNISITPGNLYRVRVYCDDIDTGQGSVFKVYLGDEGGTGNTITTSG